MYRGNQNGPIRTLTMKNRILLISGCSHTGGSEIDGSQDSEYNRKNSYGGVLAGMLDRKPVNVAMVAMSNRAIARSVLDWFSTEYDADTMDVMVLICLLYTSPSPRDRTRSRMPSSA